MIEIVSLFLGLVVGEHPLRLNVGGPVAAVEIQLDGEEVDRLEAPPWGAEVDLGSDLSPHELVVIAFDSKGQELDRDRVWINLAQDRVDAALSWIGLRDGLPTAVALTWESIGQRQPRSIELSFDGSPLAFDDPAEIPLPKYDPETLHFLSAELQFSDTVSTRIEASFGGGRVAHVETELTAVAIELDGRRRLPPPREMKGWFLADGEPVEVHGAESGPATLYAVRDLGSRPLLDRLAEERVQSMIHDRQQPWNQQQLRDFDAGAFFPMPEGLLSSDAYRNQRHLRAALVQLSRFAPLSKGTRLQFISPVAAPLHGNAVHPAMFVRGTRRDGKDGGLLWSTRQPQGLELPQQMNDAVALAGMLAQSSRGPRAVLLVHAGSENDRSNHLPEAVERYLEALQVPLVVWDLSPEDEPLAWATPTFIGQPDGEKDTADRLRDAVKALNRRLEKQHIVWLQGRRLPHSIELGPQAEGIRFAGGR